MSSAAEYDFSWVGNSHYVAIHDLVMTDGEMSIAGGKPISGGDIRDKITYLPPSAPITGWSKLPERRNTYTAMLFDPDLLSEETERQFSSTELAPLVYFEKQKPAAAASPAGKCDCERRLPERHLCRDAGLA